MEVTCRTIDVETSDVKDDAVVIEVGYYDSILEGEKGQLFSVKELLHRSDRSFFHPGDNGIATEARSIHHILDEDLKGAPSYAASNEFAIEGSPDIFIAHNADFEKRFIRPAEGARWIDTYKVALRLYPDLDRHTNQFLRYHFGLVLGDPLADPPHRALPDAYVTAHIFAKFAEQATLTDMIVWSQEPPFLTKVGFGKHFGKRWDDIPRDYAQWCLGQDFEPAVIAAARRRLGLQS